MACDLRMQSLKHTFAAGCNYALQRGGMLAQMTYGERLATALELAHRERGELALHLGISPQAVGQVIGGQTVQMKANHTARAARFLRVSPHWLATGEGEPRPKDDLSPLALELARRFDLDVPLELRERVHAQAIGAIELASASLPPTDQPAPAPKPEPAKR